MRKHRLVLQKKVLIMFIKIRNNCCIFSSVVYVDAGTGVNNPITLTVVTSGVSFARTWKMRVCQIPCSSTYRGNGIFHHCLNIILLSHRLYVFPYL